MTKEEAIAKIRQMSLPKETMELLIALAPELTESEDERVRKFLLDYAIEMIAGLESDISLSTYNGIKGHDPDAEEELSKWQKARIYLKEQKPAEWSEEDEMMILTIIQTLEMLDGRGTTGMQIDWLKSLPMKCPKKSDNWKPSEEQMDRLVSIVAALRKDNCDDMADFLAEIYHGLEKL